MYRVLYRKSKKVFGRSMSLLFGLMGLSISMDHIFNAGSSMVATGINFLGFFELPGLPLPVAVLVGLMLFWPSVKTIIISILPKAMYRKATKS